MEYKNLQNNRRSVPYVPPRGGRSGFVILFAVTLAALLLSIAVGVINIAFREIKFSTNARGTNDAFFAADTGIECALFNDKLSSRVFVANGSEKVECLNSSFEPEQSPASFWSFNIAGLGGEGKACAKITVDKTNNPRTKIISKGYDVGSSGGNCNPTENSIERQLEVNY